MSDDGDDERDGGTEEGERQLRLLGVGFVASGIVTYLLANAADPRTTLVIVLGFAGFSALVLERTQGVTPGISLGLLSGGLIAWAWPYLRASDESFAYLGGMMVVVGIINVLIAPFGVYFRKLGERLGGKER